MKSIKADKSTAPSYYVGSTNGWRLVKEALDKRGWQQLPFEYKFSSRYSLKWVERRSDIDYRSHLPGQLVCHIQNNDCITTKTGLLTAFRLYELSCRNSNSKSSSNKNTSTTKILNYSPESIISDDVSQLPTVPELLPIPSAEPLIVLQQQSKSAKCSSKIPIRQQRLRNSMCAGNSNENNVNYSNKLAASVDRVNMHCKVNKKTTNKCSKDTSNSIASSSTANISSIKTNNKAAADMLAVLSTFSEHIQVPWLPDTYLLDSTVDCTTAIDIVTNTDPDSIWIYKPSCYNRGRGIRVIKGLEAIKAIIHGIQTEDEATTVAPAKGILQRYITNPLLIPGPSSTLSAVTAVSTESLNNEFNSESIGNQEAEITINNVNVAVPMSLPTTSNDSSPGGHKFDIRCYLLLSRTTPTYLAFYSPGYCRLTLHPYTADHSKLDDPTIHLTNAAIQKQGPLYQSMKEFQIQSPQSLATILSRHGFHDNAAFILDGRLDHEIKKCLVYIVKCGIPLLNRKRGYFDLFGCDFMVTTDNKVKLLEINSNPAMSLDNSTLENLLPGIIDGTIDIVLKSQGPHIAFENNSSNDSVNDTSATYGMHGNNDPSDEDSKWCSDLPGKFELIFDENRGYEYE